MKGKEVSDGEMKVCEGHRVLGAKPLEIKPLGKVERRGPEKRGNIGLLTYRERKGMRERNR